MYPPHLLSWIFNLSNILHHWWHFLCFVSDNDDNSRTTIDSHLFQTGLLCVDLSIVFDKVDMRLFGNNCCFNHCRQPSINIYLQWYLGVYHIIHYGINFQTGCMVLGYPIMKWWFMWRRLIQSIRWINIHDIEGILQKGLYLPCVSMAGWALLVGYPRYVNSIHQHCSELGFKFRWNIKND